MPSVRRRIRTFLLLVATLPLLWCCAPKQAPEKSRVHPYEQLVPKRTELGTAGNFKVFKEGTEGDLADTAYYIVVGEKALAVFDESAVQSEGYSLGYLCILETEALKVEPVEKIPKYGASVTSGVPPVEGGQIPQDMASAAESIISLAKEILVEEEALGSLLPEPVMELIKAGAQGRLIISKNSPFILIQRAKVYLHDREVVKIRSGSLAQSTVMLDLYLWNDSFAVIYRGRFLTPKLLIIGAPGELEATPARGADIRMLKQDALKSICDLFDYLLNASSSGLVNLDAGERQKLAEISDSLKQERGVIWRRPVSRDRLENLEEIEKLWL